MDRVHRGDAQLASGTRLYAHYWQYYHVPRTFTGERGQQFDARDGDRLLLFLTGAQTCVVLLSYLTRSVDVDGRWDLLSPRGMEILEPGDAKINAQAASAIASAASDDVKAKPDERKDEL